MPIPSLILDAHAELAEGPVWLESTGELLWVDIEAGDAHWLDPTTGRDRVQHVGDPLGAAVPDRDGGLSSPCRAGSRGSRRARPSPSSSSPSRTTRTSA